jgi:hypothetical protein
MNKTKIKRSFGCLSVDTILLITQKFFGFFNQEYSFYEKYSIYEDCTYEYRLVGESYKKCYTEKIQVKFMDWFGYFSFNRKKILQIFKHIYIFVKKVIHVHIIDILRM